MMIAAALVPQSCRGFRFDITLELALTKARYVTGAAADHPIDSSRLDFAAPVARGPRARHSTDPNEISRAVTRPRKQQKSSLVAMP